MPADGILLLGAEAPLLRDAIRAQASTKMVLKIKGRIAQALQLYFLTRAAASKLRGRLGFYTSLLMGGLRRGMMGPLILRQYRPLTSKLTRTLRRRLIWRYNSSGSLPPRTTPFVLIPRSEHIRMTKALAASPAVFLSIGSLLATSTCLSGFCAWLNKKRGVENLPVRNLRGHTNGVWLTSTT